MFRFSPKGALAGGITVLLWCLVSWMILPWHQFSDLKNELEFSGAVTSSVIGRGVYILPNMPSIMDKDSLNNYQEKKLRGPTGILFVSPHGATNFSLSMFLFLGGTFFVAVLFSCLINLTSGLSVYQKAIFASLAAMTGGSVTLFPFWVWWQFPTVWTLVQIVDLGVGWFLGGLAIAKFSGSSIGIGFRLSPLNFRKKQKIPG
jgi:hypothetical protein